MKAIKNAKRSDPFFYFLIGVILIPVYLLGTEMIKVIVAITLLISIPVSILSVNRSRVNIITTATFTFGLLFGLFLLVSIRHFITNIFV
ncbi:hypothetical protein QTL97_14525 [Sporosarcina thermotolerans]|uniref:Uncharacterized protein n=1 Tax=Sporosarcina thermotolerans TaxID=633404 RepID=A0AAW9AAG8_9BACL|nr:hypothetical protein [Sporosarcina thermotolerans]MDW0118147.1 hypothetical protein [Sporosarcina thermotolerans]WHT47636.1 hypothetical protein QNH10_16065 [Sporosarcina thermotolerans]